eukprot:1136545-Pelagomonas_calceolata.AAC.2
MKRSIWPCFQATKLQLKVVHIQIIVRAQCKIKHKVNVFITVAFPVVSSPFHLPLASQHGGAGYTSAMHLWTVGLLMGAWH